MARRIFSREFKVEAVRQPPMSAAFVGQREAVSAFPERSVAGVDGLEPASVDRHDRLSEKTCDFPRGLTPGGPLNFQEKLHIL